MFYIKVVEYSFSNFVEVLVVVGLKVKNGEGGGKLIACYRKTRHPERGKQQKHNSV